jgi:DNA-binding NarL/FixJ family response regulator
MTQLLNETYAVQADRAWRAGELTAAIEAADRALSHDDDPDCLAAGVAAAAAAADGSLFDAADRWRGVASVLPGAAGAQAGGRAALAAALLGDVEVAGGDFAGARELLPGAAPRGLTVLLDGVAATLAAVGGDFDTAARRLAGLAVASVPADPMVSERWDDLAVTVMVAGGADRTARETLAATPDRQTTRRRLLAAWLDLRTGRLADARAGLAAAGGTQILRRDAVLAAATAVGLARRAGDDDALRATWHRVAPVVAGVDVEVLLLDAWGELSVGAALVAPVERDSIEAAMTGAVDRAGGPSWGVATLAWWALQRAVVAGDPATAAAAASLLTGDDARSAAARVWAQLLNGTVDAAAVQAAAVALADADRPWEAATLCGAAASRLTDAATVRDLLGTSRALRATVEPRTAGGGLSTRERSVGELLLDGLTQKEIGARLYISPKTVEQHVARLRQKLSATNRSELIAALRTKLVVAVG